jgi:DNA replication protein DnaC
MKKKNTIPAADEKQLREDLEYLKLHAILANYGQEARDAAAKERTHVEYLARLVEAESHARSDRSTQRRISMARFPVIKTIEQFQWDWPSKINRLQVDNLMRLRFADEKGNVIILGGVGLGKTHLCTALGYEACLRGHSVLFSSAIDIINSLSGAQSTGKLKKELAKYLRPQVLIIDELGYLPIDRNGANLLFQVISQRYERGSIILSTNKAFRKWPEVFSNDSTLASAVLDRLLHHAETVLIEGKSYRMKDQTEI